MQDKQLAADFTSAIAHYDSEVSRLDDLLQSETDPDKIAELENERAFNLSRKTEVAAKLESIRRRIDGPQNLQILVN